MTRVAALYVDPNRPYRVAALYVDPNGPYPRLCSNWYDKERGAENYAGPWPVVAHPPCGPWSRLKHFCTKQDPQAALTAVDQVLKFGGVLEHPAGSSLWSHCGLPSPFKKLPALVPRVWSLEVNQVNWGHECLKTTWLLFVGVNPRQVPELPPAREPVKVVTTSLKTADRRPNISWRKRHLTPPAFAEWLLKTAHLAGQ